VIDYGSVFAYNKYMANDTLTVEKPTTISTPEKFTSQSPPEQAWQQLTHGLLTPEKMLHFVMHKDEPGKKTISQQKEEAEKMFKDISFFLTSNEDIIRPYFDDKWKHHSGQTTLKDEYGETNRGTGVAEYDLIEATIVVCAYLKGLTEFPIRKGSLDRTALRVLDDGTYQELQTLLQMKVPMEQNPDTLKTAATPQNPIEKLSEIYRLIKDTGDYFSTLDEHRVYPGRSDGT
jgi:hypothetical protein